MSVRRYQLQHAHPVVPPARMQSPCIHTALLALAHNLAVGTALKGQSHCICWQRPRLRPGLVCSDVAGVAFEGGIVCCCCLHGCWMV